MEQQLAAAAQQEAETELQEAQHRAEAESAAERLEERREETMKSLAEHRKRVAAEVAAAEALRVASAAVQQESATQRQEYDLLEIQAQVKEFHRAFKEQHSRSPKAADLELAENVRMKVMIERYHLLKHRVAPSGLQGGRDRSRVVRHNI